MLAFARICELKAMHQYILPKLDSSQIQVWIHLNLFVLKLKKWMGHKSHQFCSKDLVFTLTYACPPN